jgi:hypothetical protein
MGMRGTRSVQNGDPNSRDIYFGWFVKAIATAMLGLCTLGVERGFVISAKIDAMEARQVLVLSRLDRIEKNVDNEDYLSKEDFRQWLYSQNRADSVLKIIDTGKPAPAPK